jgi:UDP-glucose 4-epimerase
MKEGSIIVTGGCGYIGSHTIIELLTEGYKVVSIDNFSRSSPTSLDNIKKITGVDVKNYCIDLCSSSELLRVLGEIGAVNGIIHFAAYKSVPESVMHPERYYHNNLGSVINILDSAKVFGVKNFVFSSSCSVYGDVRELPVSERTPLASPKSPYASTKIMGERIVSDICRAYNINAMCLRYFNPVGAHPSGLIGEMPLERPDNLVPVITQTAIGKLSKMTVFGGELPTRDGSCIRDYVHVMDISRAHLMALKYMEDRRDVMEIINLGTGSGVSVFDAIRTFEAISGLKVNYHVGPPRDGDVIEIYSDVKKALKLLGWEAQYSVVEMMDSAWKWEKELSKAGIFD